MDLLVAQGNHCRSCFRGLAGRMALVNSVTGRVARLTRTNQASNELPNQQWFSVALQN